MIHNAHRWVQGVHKVGSWVTFGVRQDGMTTTPVQGQVVRTEDQRASLITYYDPALVDL